MVTGRRRVFREGAWRLMEPLQKGLLLGVLGGALLSLLTWQVLWMGAGVFLGVGIGSIVGHRRRTPHRPGSSALTGGPVRRPGPRPEETPEQWEERLNSAATFNGVRMLEGRTDRAGALEQMRDTVPGFPPDRYAAELDRALTRMEELRVGVRSRRARLVEEAREMDVLNGVFALRYYNGRFSGHPGEYGLGPIDLIHALGDLYPREVIEEALARADALIKEGIAMGIGSWDSEPNMAYLRQAHPGFDDRALGKALDWGHLIYR